MSFVSVGAERQGYARAILDRTATARGEVQSPCCLPPDPYLCPLKTHTELVLLSPCPSIQLSPPPSQCILLPHLCVVGSLLLLTCPVSVYLPSLPGCNLPLLISLYGSQPLSEGCHSLTASPPPCSPPPLCTLHNPGSPRT